MDERLRKRRKAVRWESRRGRRTALFLAGVLLVVLVAFLVLRSTGAFAVQNQERGGSRQERPGPSRSIFSRQTAYLIV